MYQVLFKLSHFSISGGIEDTGIEQFNTDDVYFFIEFLTWLRERTCVSIIDVRNLSYSHVEVSDE